MYALFAVPPDKDLEWQEEGVAGISRFLSRVYRLTTKYASVVKSTGPHAIDVAAVEPSALKLLRKLHQTIAKITLDFSGRWHFNTSIAAIMELVNEIVATESEIDKGALGPAEIAHVFTNLVLLLTPFAPFMTAELWEQIGGKGVVFRAPWPVSNPELLQEDEMEIPVQMNGKLVNVVKVPVGSEEDVVKTAALADSKVAARLEGKTVVKVIVVPGKLVNLVVK